MSGPVCLSLRVSVSLGSHTGRKGRTPTPPVRVSSPVTARTGHLTPGIPGSPRVTPGTQPSTTQRPPESRKYRYEGTEGRTT